MLLKFTFGFALLSDLLLLRLHLLHEISEAGGHKHGSLLDDCAGVRLQGSVLVLEQGLVHFIIVGLFHLVVASLTASLLGGSAEAESSGAATLEGPLVATISELGLGRVVEAVLQMGPEKLLVAGLAVECIQVGPDSPVDLLPLKVLGAVEVLNEAIYVEEAVGGVLSDGLTMEVDEYFGIGTEHPVGLLTGEHLVALYAALQNVGLLVWASLTQEGLQLFLEELGSEFIALVNQVVESFYSDSLRNLLDE